MTLFGQIFPSFPSSLTLLSVKKNQRAVNFSLLFYVNPEYLENYNNSQLPWVLPMSLRKKKKIQSTLFRIAFVITFNSSVKEFTGFLKNTHEIKLKLTQQLTVP